MSNARENKSLSVMEYDIDGNSIRAYYDKSHKLIFVLDETINADKPNVLLVIDSFDGRKWDDVLANDYGVDLETVRPKRDNKYQKLDIEYGGLDVYSELIDAEESGDDLSDAIANLNRFRTMSVRRTARERLSSAEDTIEKSRETIERTNDTISELRSRVKELRARINEFRRGIGREPTKASAAKILKAEAQLDATNEKLTRAKKRLNSAQHRLANAEDDAEIARAILARNVSDVKTKKSVSSARKAQPVIVEPTKPVADVDYEIEDEEDVLPEPKAEEMDNDEVKPLFDKDPENLDDEMAFKPIDFGTGETVSKPEPVAPAPLSFTPPVQQPSESRILDETPVSEPEISMLDRLEPLPTVELSDIQEVAPVEEPVAPQPFEPVTEQQSIETIAPIAPVAPVTPMRPVSPVAAAATPVEQKTQKSTFVYYLMLILLIILSIGTLWLYQKSTNENIPDLAKPVPETVVPAPTNASGKVAANPFVAAPDVAKGKIVEEPSVVEIPEPVAAPGVGSEPVSMEPEPVVIAEPDPEPIVVEPEPVAVVEETVTVEAEPIMAEPEPVEVIEESPFVDLEPAVTTIAPYEPEPVKIPTEEEVIASKPGYNVSQNDNMFVASDDYDTEIVFTGDDEESAELTSVCEGGVAPDSMGCCPGENYTYTDDGFMCCNTVECFPPAE